MSDSRSDIAGQNAIIYARVSTNDHGQRVDTQERDLRDYCARKGLNVVAYFYDEGETGSHMVRPGISQALMHVISNPPVHWVVAWDTSRITRGQELDMLQNALRPYGCQVRFAKDDLDPNSLGAQVIHSIDGVFDSEENKVRREKTKNGMKTRKMDGVHCGRPAVFMFEEDLEDAPEGRYMPEHVNKKGQKVPATKVITESQFYNWAKEGYSLSYVAKRFLGVSKSALIAEIMPREEIPEKRLRKYAKYKKFPTESDYIEVYRFKGKKDRYTPYKTLYEQAINERKGLSSETVGKTSEIGSERVGIE